MSAADIGFVSANGLATVPDDIAEAQAIRAELADVPVWAAKSYFGNLGAGTATIETAATICALIHDEVPATLNYDVPDPRCPVHVTGCSRKIGRQPTAALILSQAPTGQAAAVVLGTP